MQYTLKQFDALTNIELYQLLKLRQEVFIIEQSCIYPDIDDKDKGSYHLLAFEGGTLLGGLRILGKGLTFDTVSIGRLLVVKNHRGCGIARALMRQALDFIVTEMQETRIKISAQTYALPFYESLGFEMISKKYLEDGIPHVDMIYISKN